MTGRKFNFSITQLLLITALCALAAGLVAASRRETSTRHLDLIGFSPDGRLLAALGEQDALVVWDLSRDPARRADSSMEAALSRYDSESWTFIDESTVAGIVSAEILVWDVIRNARKMSIPLKYVPYAVAFSSEGRRAATIRQLGGPVEIWDLATGKQCGTVTPTSPPHLVAISEDGTTLTVVPFEAAYRPAMAEIWSVNPPKLLKTLNVGSISGYDVLSPDGRWLFTFTPRSKAIRDLTSGLSMPLASAQWPRNAHFSPDGRSLATLGADGVDVWDTGTGKLRGRIARIGSQYGYLADSAAFSPDGELLAILTDKEVTLWDAHTCRRIRTINRSRRLLSIVMFSTGFVAWAVVWGVVSRRRRQRESRHAPAEAAPSKLPAGIQASLQPGRTWLRFLLMVAVFAAVWAWILAGSVQHTWGLAYWGAFAAVFAVVLVAFPALLLLGLWLWRITVWRTKGILARNVKRAAKAAGMPGRRVEFGPVTAVFFGPSQFELTIQQEYEAVLKRFSDMVGDSVEPHDPLLILVFERPEMFDAYFDGHMPLGGVYWAFRGRQIITCEQTSLDHLTEPRRVLSFLFGNYFWEQYKGFLAEPWLQMLVSRLAAADSKPDVLRRDHRSIRVWQQRDAASIEPGLLTMPQLEAVQLLLDTRRSEGFRRSTCYGYQMASLAEFLAGPHSGERRERFQRFLRDLKRRERSEQVFTRHFGYGFDRLIHDWHAWALTQEIHPYDSPPPIVKQHIEQHFVPLIANENAPLAERAEAVQNVGAGAYPTGAYALIDLLRSGAGNPLRDDVVWALERISGEAHGVDVAAWQDWWERSLHLQELHDDAPVAEAVEAVLVADDEAPVLAELADESDDPIRHEHQERSEDSAKPTITRAASQDTLRETPGALKACWALFVVAGIIAIIWSVVSVFLLYHPFNSGVWTVVGCYGIAAGVFAIARGVGRELDRLKPAATMLFFCIINCNFISAALGIAIHFVLLRPDLRAFVSAGPRRSRLPDGT